MNGSSVLMMLQRYVFSRGGSTLLGLGCVAALVWYAGPMVGLGSPTLRLGIILGLVALCLTVMLARWAIGRWRGNRLQAELANQADGRAAERAAEIDAIKSKMDEAIASLKSSELGSVHRGKAALYALPWYMIIGPSAAGKSTLLRNSGLHFPYASADDLHLKGFGGTRNCDWWFSDQAILLDTAGRYTTEEDDRDEWLTFLGLLRKHRSRMPINGVIVAMSLSDLLTCDGDGLERHVQILRERIQELMKHLGLVFPVFVVFTKCDLIRGFEAFFEDLSEQERNQLWGAYLFDAKEGEQSDPAALFENRMRALYAKLCEMRLRKMSMQRNLERKAALFDFPNQFWAAADRLTEFVSLLFRANPYQETPRFAGVYFTSGTQEGAPLQRLMGNLRQAFGLGDDPKPVRQGPPKPYFIKSLFTDVVFQLQSAARVGRRRLLLQRWLKATSVAAACAALAGAFVLLSGAFARNTLALGEGTTVVEALSESLRQEPRDPAAEYAALEKLYDYYTGLKAGAGGSSGLLLNTVDQQAQPIEALLADVLEQSFYRRSVLALEFRLDNLARQWDAASKTNQEKLRDEYYQALKTYLMVAAQPDRLDAAAAEPLLKTLWAQTLGFVKVNETAAALGERAPRMDGLIRFYLERLPARLAANAHATREDLIAKARSQLHTGPNPEQLYVQLKSKASTKFTPVALDDLLSGQNRGRLESRAKLDGLFTAKAWHGYVRAQIDGVVDLATRGDWVLMTGEAVPAEPEVDAELAEALKRGVRQLYFREYADTWLAFLGGMRTPEFRSFEEASAALSVLARSDGPIGELMQVTGENISLTETELPKLPQLPAGADAAVQAVPVKRVPELERELMGLRRFTEVPEKKSVSDPVDQYLLVLAGLRGEVERLSASVDVARDAQAYAAALVGNGSAGTQLYRGWVSATSLLNGSDARTRDALQGLFSAPTRDVWELVVGEARRQIEREWQYAVVGVYQSQLQGKFPFNPKGPDATVDDVAEFFRPDNGVLWSYVNQNLAPFLVETRSGWRERRWLGQGVSFSPAFLHALQEARSITNGLFKRGGSAPELTFYVYPMPSPGLSEMTLEANGQSYRYRNEPQEWRRFAWPGTQDQLGARISGIVSRGAARAEISANGPWALFRLLQQASVTGEGGAVYLSEWDLDAEGYGQIRVAFRIRADRQNSVFQQRALAGFGLPSSPFGGGRAGAVAEAR